MAMKRLLYAILTVFLILFTACSESDYKKAQQLTDAFDASFLKENQSVKAIGKVHLDSARIEYIHLASTQEALQRARRLSEENKQCLDALKQPVVSEVAYRILTKQLWDTGKAVEELQKQLMQEERTYKARVPGWMTYHRFRVVGKDGKMTLRQYILYFDLTVDRISGLVNLNDSIPIYRPTKSE